MSFDFNSRCCFSGCGPESVRSLTAIIYIRYYCALLAARSTRIDNGIERGRVVLLNLICLTPSESNKSQGTRLYDREIGLLHMEALRSHNSDTSKYFG